MPETRNLISLVIHTPARAARLKEVLEAHDIYVEFEEICYKSLNFQSSPLKVMIDIEKLPMALKILESGDLVSTPLAIPKMENSGNTILIPVDFSPSSMLAVKVGFHLAKKLQLFPVILHSFLAPQFTPSEFYESQVDPMGQPDMEEVEEEMSLQKMASSQLARFKKTVEKAILDEELADVKFTTTLLEGVPEQVIHEYCRQNSPLLIVMATRGVDKKESDLIGSVTAEVIDSCRVPILTVPENHVIRGVENIRNITLFCSFTSFDAVAVRALMRMFDYPQCNFWLIPANESATETNIRKLDNLKTYLAEIFPTATFNTDTLGKGKFDDLMRLFLNEHNINMIIVPNKKSNAISRFFRPTLAHKILFERDIPLLVLPI